MHSPSSILALKKLEVQDLHALVQFVCHTHIIREKEIWAMHANRKWRFSFLYSALAKYGSVKAY